jgi:hypothetical protein
MVFVNIHQYHIRKSKVDFLVSCWTFNLCITGLFHSKREGKMVEICKASMSKKMSEIAIIEALLLVVNNNYSHNENG